MTKSPSILTLAFSALALTGTVAAFDPSPAAAQKATKLACKGCIKSKQIEDNKIKSRDIKDGQVTTSDLAQSAVTSAKIAAAAVDGDKIANDAVGVSKLGSDVTALGLSGVAVLGPGAFHALDGTADNAWSIVSAGYVEGTSPTDEGCVVAQVDLPDGVTITEMELLFVDDSTLLIEVQLNRISLVDGRVSFMAFVNTSGIDDDIFRSVSETNIIEPVVDAVDFTYIVYTDNCLRLGHRIYGVRIHYG